MDDERLPELEPVVAVDLSACRAPDTTIRSASDLDRFQRHQTYKLLIGFLQNVNHAIKSKPNSAPCHVSDNTERMLALLDTLSRWVDEIPPIQQPMRYGNKAFRTWIERLEEVCFAIDRPLATIDTTSLN
jgi:serine/threonine-protein phosphatase 2A activator